MTLVAAILVAIASALFLVAPFGKGVPLAQASVENTPATGAPTIIGTAQVGETLTANITGIADTDGLDNVSFSYQWLSSRDTAISGATGETYTLVSTDLGKIIKVKVTFTDDAGNDETLTSPATDAVEASANSAGICDRTAQVRETILDQLPDTSDCAAVTDTGLSGIIRLALSEKGITTLKSGDFSGLSNLQHLNLADNELSALPDGIFDDLTGLESLYLYSNRLSELPDGIFDDLTGLESLDLYNNRLSELPDNIFDNLAGLESLSLGGNEISELPDSVFDNLAGLESLSLDGNWISELPDGVFDNLTGLESLSLAFNDLSELPDGVFDNLTRLYSLGVGINDLGELPDGIFDNLTGLGALELTNIDLSELPDGIFDELTRLDTLVLSDNELSELPDGIFDELTRLWSLKLDGNDLSELPDGVFDSLTNLRTLNLADNDLNELPDGIVDSLTKLRTLSLGGNELSALPEDVFDNLAKLQSLDLNSNELSELPEVIFDGLTELQYLHLNGNELSELPDGVFDNLSELWALSLIGNELSELPDGIFGNLANLKQLYLFSNKLSELPDRIFYGLASMNILYIDENTGSPFTLTAEPERTDENTIALKVAQATPFDMEVTLSAEGGTLSSATVTIPAGNISSAPVTVSPDGAEPVTISAVSAAFLLGESQEARGIQTGLGNHLTLGEDSDTNTPSTGAPTIRGTVQAGETLMADTADIADADGLTGATFSYQWLGSRDTEIQGATNATYTLVADDEGKTIKVRVTFTDDGGNNETLTSAPTAVVSAAPPPPPDNVGAVTQKSGAVELTWEAPDDATVTGYRIERRRADENRGGQQRSDGRPRDNHTVVDDTGSADTGYTDESAEKGVEYEYRVSARNEAGPGEGSDWVRAGPGTASNTPATGAPTISGTAQVGETLTADITGIADADGLSGETFTYQWVSGDTAITGATSYTYTLMAADEGKAITVTVSFTDDGGNEETLTSAQTATVEARSNSAGICDRTERVRDNIIGLLNAQDLGSLGIKDCSEVTDEQLTRIRFLDLAGGGTGGKITSLKSGDFEGLSGMSELNLEDNSLSELPEGVFDGLSSLELLTMQGNDLSSLPDGVFDDLNLHTLALYDNDLAALPDGVFDGLTKLSTLAISDNKLTALSGDVFTGLGGLTSLVASNNKLTSLPDGVFSGMSKLQSVSFSGNPSAPFTLPAELERRGEDGVVVKVSEGAPFAMTVTLSAEGGTLSATTVVIGGGDTESAVLTVTPEGAGAVTVSVDSAAFPDAGTVHDGIQTGVGGSLTLETVASGICDRTAQVRDAILEMLPDTSDCALVTETDLSYLQGSLELNNSDITTLKSGDFEGLSRLSGIKLRHNNLSALPDGVFDDLGDLQVLYLDANHLSELPAGVFDDLTNLVYLNLGQNGLSELPAGVFDELSNLVHLYLSFNNNPNPAVYPENTLDEDDLSAGVLGNLSKLRKLSLSDNNLSVLPDGLFTGLPSLVNVDLIGNPGATFTVTAELKQNGDAVVIKVTQGAPFDMLVTLSAEGGTLATTTVTVEGGSDSSGPVTVTPTGEGGTPVTVSVESVTFQNYQPQHTRGIQAGTGTSLTLNTPATDPVASASNNPATGLPTIRGTAQVGETLTADITGIADADGMENDEVSFQWSAYDNATGLYLLRMIELEGTYTIEPRDVGMAISVIAIFTDDRGNTESRESAPTEPVAAAANTPAAGAPVIIGTAQVGETLTADTSGIADMDGLTNGLYGYQWVKNDGTTDSDITGAMGSTYRLGADDQGKAIKLRVRFSDDAGNWETLTSSATAAVPIEATFTFKIDGTTVTCDSYDVHIVPKKECADPTSIDQGENTDIEVGIEIDRSVSRQSHKFRFGIYQEDDTLGRPQGHEANDFCLGPGLAESVSIEVAPADGTGPFTYTDEGTIFELCPAGTYVLAVFWDRYNYTDQEYEYAGTFRRYFFINGNDEVDTSIERVKFITALYPDPPVSHDDVQIEATKGSTVLNRELATFSLSIGGLVPDSDPDTTDYVVRLRVIGDDGPNEEVAWCHVGNVGYSYLLKTVPEDGRLAMDAHVLGSCLWHWWPDTLQIELFNGSYEFIAGKEIALGELPNSPATGAPTINGAAEIGEKLTVSTSGIQDANGLSGATFSYQWLGSRDTEIQGATNATYTLVAADEGKAIKVRVSFTDDRGNAESLTSAPTSAVEANANNPATGLPTISGTAQVGETLTAGITGIADADGLSGESFTYQWVSGDGTTDTDIENATGATYKLVDADQGKAIKVRVTFTDGGGNEETLTSAPTGAVEEQPVLGDGPPGAPRNLAATAGNREVTLSWDPPADNGNAPATGYRIEWRVDGKDYDKTIWGTARSTTYTTNVNANLANGVKYFFRVSAGNGSGNSYGPYGPASGEVSATPTSGSAVDLGTPVLSNTENLHHGMVRLDWQDVEDAGWYVVQYYHLDGGSGEWVDLPAEGVDIAFHGSSAVVSNLHGLSWLRVGAMSCAGASEWSQIEELYGTNASDWEGVPVPEVEEGDEIEPCPVVLGTPVLSDTENLHHGMVRLDWQDIEDAGWYVVQYYHVKGGEWLDLPAEGVDIAFHGSSAVVSNLHGLSWLRVRAMSCAGASEWSQIEQSFGTNASDWEGVPVPEVAEGDEIEPCSEDADTPDNSPATGAPTISGTAQVRETLTANTSGIADADGLSNVQYEYQWLADAADISGATNATYTLADTDEGKAIKVEVSFTDDAGNEETLTSRATDAVAAASTPNSPATGAPTISGTAQVGETLTANTSGIADADGLGSVQYEYQWLADDTEIAGATNATYTLAAADEGKAIKVQVSFTDDAGNEERLTSAATDAVAAQPQTNSPATGAPTITGTAQVGETLTVNTTGIADADGLDNVSFSYQWLSSRDTAISGATGETYTLASTDLGKIIKVQVSFTDDAGNEETLISAATDAVAAVPTPNRPATGLPSISGTAQVGETLTADTSGIADEDGLINATYSFQWLADNTEIAGATSSTYTLADTDEGQAIKVEVTFTDDAGNEETLTSEATDAVSVAPTPNTPTTGAPTISGTSRVGETLTADTSGIADADGLSSVQYDYQWLADDSEISGATSSTYTVAAADEGKAIKVEVSFTDDAGNEETLTSEATDAVAAAEPSEPPSKPRGLKATSTHDSVTLTWNDPEDDSISGYVILRRVRVNDQGGDFSVLVADTESAATTYTDNEVAASTTYTYRIKAINEAGTSERSRWVHIDTPAPPVPDKPTGLEAAASNGQVVLTWDDPDDDSITGYVILRRLPGVDPEGQFDELVADTGTAATTYTDSSVEAETRYTYRIKAINEHGTSERSRWSHIDTPAAP